MLTDCSTAFNTVRRTAVLAEETNCVPALTPLVSKSYGTRPVDVFFRMNSGETRKIACSSDVQQGDPVGPGVLCLASRPGQKRGVRGRRIGKLHLHGRYFSRPQGVTANRVRAFAFLRRELEDIGIVVNTANTVALTPKGHAPTAEISLLASVDVRIVDEGGVTVVGVSIGTDKHVLERTFEVVRGGGADRLARCLANMPDKQAAAVIAIESLEQRTSYLERALDTGLSLEA